MYKKTQKFKLQQARKKRVQQTKQYVFWGICMVCVIYSLRELNHTFVQKWPVILVWAISGIVISSFIIKEMSSFWAGVFFSGAILVALLVLINNTFSDTRTQFFKVGIIHKHHESRKTSAKADVEFAGINETIFAVNDRQLDTSSYIVLGLNRGYWGYYILKNSRFVKE